MYYGIDLNINKLIRDNFLDEDGAFLVEIEEGLTLYESHDKFLRTLTVLESVKVYGLDTIESFEPLEDIGKYTLQNELSFRYLTMEVGIIMGYEAVDTTRLHLCESTSSSRRRCRESYCQVWC